MTALIVIGSILLLLFLLAMLNLKLYLRYEDEEFTMKFGVLCFWKQLVPYTEQEKKAQKPAKTQKKEQPKEKKKIASAEITGGTEGARAAESAGRAGKTKALEKSGGAAAVQKGYPPAEKDWKETAKTVYDIIRSVIRPSQFMLRNVRISGLQLHVVVGGEEPDETAIRFGHWNAAVYGCLATARNFMKVDVKKIMIAVDFTSPETEFRADGTIKVRFFVAVVSVVRMFWNILANTLKRRKEQQVPSQQAAASA